ncbi:UNVERIFIED_CONTAM: hypothetical protein PYX00_005535 [Menopon gallinae]|uniref:Protein rogdi n=1 Tax=Menopon gallinae TaxID=328185 RepID=A0AAW2HTH6_9NEOP
MAEGEKDEAALLQLEFQWILDEEVHAVFSQLKTILNECAKRFPLNISLDNQQKQEKYSLTSPTDNIKCNVLLSGDTIVFGEISFKIQRHQHVIYRTTITHENPWKLQQIQDAGNHLQQALRHINNIDDGYNFTSSEEVLHILGKILGALQRGRTSLIVPRKRTIDDLMKSRNMKMLVPNLPEDLAISFYIQSHKIVFAVYQIQPNTEHGQTTFNTLQAEASVPWTNEVLVLFTVALQLAQQLKDKISVFSQYKDFHIALPNKPSIVLESL